MCRSAQDQAKRESLASERAEPPAAADPAEQPNRARERRFSLTDTRAALRTCARRPSLSGAPALGGASPSKEPAAQRGRSRPRSRSMLGSTSVHPAPPPATSGASCGVGGSRGAAGLAAIQSLAMSEARRGPILDATTEEGCTSASTSTSTSKQSDGIKGESSVQSGASTREGSVLHHELP